MRSDKGFTLIELVVVIAVITVLAGIMVPMIQDVAESGRVTRTAAEMKNIADAANRYLVDVGSYPWSISDGAGAWGGPVGLESMGTAKVSHQTDSWKGPYLRSWPTKTAWGKLIGCAATGAYYFHSDTGWINRDPLNPARYIHTSTSCVFMPLTACIRIDRAIDDGNPSGGEFRCTGGALGATTDFPYSYYYVGEGSYF